MRIDSSVLSLFQETLFCELAEHPGLQNHFPKNGVQMNDRIQDQVSFFSSSSWRKNLLCVFPPLCLVFYCCLSAEYMGRILSFVAAAMLQRVSASALSSRTVEHRTFASRMRSSFLVSWWYPVSTGDAWHYACSHFLSILGPPRFDDHALKKKKKKMREQARAERKTKSTNREQSVVKVKRRTTITVSRRLWIPLNVGYLKLSCKQHKTRELEQ
jgi:hypothetical protein